jgi:hypothetical protein
MNTPRPNPDAQLRQALLGLAADISARQTPPPAATIWLRAERRSRQLAIQRATRPLRLMYAFAAAAALIAAVFALYQSGPATTTVLTQLLRWSAPAAVLILAGCWMLLRAGRTEPSVPNKLLREPFRCPQ